MKTQINGSETQRNLFFFQVLTTMGKLHDCKNITIQNGNNKIKLETCPLAKSTRHLTNIKET